jgi:hypothetical protein
MGTVWELEPAGVGRVKGGEYDQSTLCIYKKAK